MTVLFSCKKENNTPNMTDEELPTVSVVLSSGNFANAVHPTSGTVKVIKDASDKRYLLFENFKTDGGPDLRVWLSPTTSANPFQEIGLLKATNGNFSYELPASFDPVTNNKVLIWCKQFGVLFGSATLQ